MEAGPPSGQVDEPSACPLPPGKPMMDLTPTKRFDGIVSLGHRTEMERSQRV